MIPLIWHSRKGKTMEIVKKKKKRENLPRARGNEQVASRESREDKSLRAVSD